MLRKTNEELTEAVRATSLLADVTMSLWGAERTDRTIMDDAKARAGATGNVGRAIKNLLSGADENFKLARAGFAAIRTAHYSMTLPWVADPQAERQRGPRLLPCALFDRYLETLGERRAAATQALQAFVASYPGDAARARQNLGDLARADDYPDVAEIPRLFRVGFSFEPIPAGAQFHGLPDVTVHRLTANLERKQAAMAEVARTAMWSEVRERVEHVVTRLGDPEGRFRVSTIDAVRELVDLVPAWNLVGDERADEVVEDLRRMLDGVDVKRIRDAGIERTAVVEGAQAVVDRLNGWGL